MPYETARQLMEAVLYCIEENKCGAGASLQSEEKLPSVQIMYERGYEILIGKVHEAKEIYEGIIRNFQSYWLENYDATIRSGMPAFFLRYDPKFNPQDHLLTLDYPLLNGRPDRCGIDLILEYLKGIQKEKAFQDCLDRAAVIRVLERIIPEYEELYLDNICDAVLFESVCCLIAENPLRELRMTEDDYEAVRFYFDGDDKAGIERKIVLLIRMMMEHLKLDSANFEPIGKDYAFRIWQRIQRK